MKFSKSGVQFILSADPSLDWSHFKCSPATWELVAIVLDSTELESYLLIVRQSWPPQNSISNSGYVPWSEKVQLHPARGLSLIQYYRYGHRSGIEVNAHGQPLSWW